MSATRKPRADSRLKNLPEERQAAIIELLRTKTQGEVRKELAKDGLETSEAALSGFYHWWQLRQQFNRSQDLSESIVDMLKEERPDLSPEALEQYGDQVFKMSALQLQEADPETAAKIWHWMGKLRLDRESVNLDRQKFQRETCELFLKWAADKRAKQIAESKGLEQSEKIQKLGQLMFQDDWSQGAAQAR